MAVHSADRRHRAGVGDQRQGRAPGQHERDDSARLAGDGTGLRDQPGLHQPAGRGRAVGGLAVDAVRVRHGAGAAGHGAADARAVPAGARIGGVAAELRADADLCAGVGLSCAAAVR
ncbi:hypothetical protein IMCC9480_1615 [Oxalobacteraceae bacterium IMCC9480]|nr:hypothetical protein IMCC9480_1615 [Oxalobacteraceae bacterium IMCC9480]